MAGKTSLVTHTELKVLEENQWLDCSVRSSGWGKHSLLYILPQEHCEKSLQKRKCMNLIMNSSAQMTHMHITCKILIVVLIFVEHNYNNIAVDYNWFKRYLMFGHTWLPSPFPRPPPPSPISLTLSLTHTHIYPFLCCYQTLRLWNVHHTSDLRESHPNPSFELLKRTKPAWLWLSSNQYASPLLL